MYGLASFIADIYFVCLLSLYFFLNHLEKCITNIFKKRKTLKLKVKKYIIIISSPTLNTNHRRLTTTFGLITLFFFFFFLVKNSTVHLIPIFFIIKGLSVFNLSFWCRRQTHYCLKDNSPRKFSLFSEIRI